MSDQKIKANYSGKVRPINFDDEAINSHNDETNQKENNTVSLPPIAQAKKQGIRFDSNPKNLSRDVSEEAKSSEGRKFPVFGKATPRGTNDKKLVIQDDNSQSQKTPIPSHRSQIEKVDEEVSGNEEDGNKQIDETQVPASQTGGKP